MKFEDLKSFDIFSRTKRAFEVKNIFLVSQKLSFRLEKQTSKNVVNATFNKLSITISISWPSFMSKLFNIQDVFKSVLYLMC